MTFVALHNHSEFSLSDGILRIDQLVDFAKKENIPAIALTDRNNLYAALKFYKKARAKGIKPILGVDLTVRDEDGNLSQLVLLAMNKDGFIRLCELVSYAYTKDQKNNEVAVDISRFTSLQCQDVLALSGGSHSDIFAFCQKDLEKAIERVKFWQKIFDDRYYLQLSRLGKQGEDKYFEFCSKYHQALKAPAVVANLGCFLSPKDFEVHEIRTCISAGYVIDDPRRPKFFTDQFYLKPKSALLADFGNEILLENSLAIAKKCNVELDLNRVCLPDFPVQNQTIEQFLTEKAEKGLNDRLNDLFDKEELIDKKANYENRLKEELAVINKMGFAGYFLIVADFIDFAKKNDIPVGPGRGSGAGSLVAFALSITDIDPLPYDLLFERFLNPERISMPDFDVDFCMDKRDQVISYVAKKYGLDRVSQIATHGTMAAKAVVRDVGRVLGMSYGFCDRLSKAIPAKPLGTTLSDALGRTAKSQEEPARISQTLIEEYEQNDDAKNLIDIALQLEGLARNVGKHAGGVVIAPSKLTDFSALYSESAGAPISVQFDKGDIEEVGLVKFDFLGLRTLTVIDWAVKLINQQKIKDNQPLLDLSKLKLTDKKTFDLLKTGNTTAVFQLESSGMQELIRKLKPDNFEDIVALVALYRPGPLQSGMVDDFIQRKHGLAKVEYPHPDLESILKTTYGVMVYQEQVMQVAQVLAKYSLGEADLLRRAMGKKKKEVMDEQKTIFVERSVAYGLQDEKAGEIFDLMAKFAEYGFNKSHSAAYAVLSYQTAWLKAHYPAEFMAAVLTSEMDDVDKIVRYIDETIALEIKINKPDINQSLHQFSVKDEEIVYGLGAVKGLGLSAISAIIEERKKGKFTSLEDICMRIDSKKLGRKNLEILICAGAFDGLNENRGALFKSLEKLLKLADQHHKNKSIAQNDIFGLFDIDVQANKNLSIIDESYQWEQKLLLEKEKEVLGFYLSDHPINSVKDVLQKICPNDFKNIKNQMKNWQIPKNKNGKKYLLIGGLISDLRFVNSKKNGEPMVFVTLDDKSDRFEFGVFGEETVRNYEQILSLDNVVVAKVSARYFEYKGEWSFSVENLWDFHSAKIDFLQKIFLNINLNDFDDDKYEKLKNCLINNKQEKGLVVLLSIKLDNINAKISLPYNYAKNSQFIDSLGEILGKDNVVLDY